MIGDTWPKFDNCVKTRVCLECATIGRAEVGRAKRGLNNGCAAPVIAALNKNRAMTKQELAGVK